MQFSKKRLLVILIIISLILPILLFTSKKYNFYGRLCPCSMSLQSRQEDLSNVFKTISINRTNVQKYISKILISKDYHNVLNIVKTMGFVENISGAEAYIIKQINLKNNITRIVIAIGIPCIPSHASIIYWIYKFDNDSFEYAEAYIMTSRILYLVGRSYRGKYCIREMK